MSHDHPKASLMGSSRHQVTPSVYGYPKVPCGIVWRSSYHNLQGCVRTVPGRPSWDCLDMMSYQLAGMYRDCPRMSRHQVIPACRDVPGHPRTPFLGSSGLGKVVSCLSPPDSHCVWAVHYVWTVLGCVQHLQAILDNSAIMEA